MSEVQRLKTAYRAAHTIQRRHTPWSPEWGRAVNEVRRALDAARAIMGETYDFPSNLQKMQSASDGR